MNINNAILHVFDFVSCVNVFAQAPMDLGNKAAKRYVTSQAKRVTKSHKIRTDTGIELTFPAEYGENSDFIEFFSTPDGRIEIALKNIGAIENR